MLNLDPVNVTETAHASVRVVDQLIRNHDRARPHVEADAANGIDRDQLLAAQLPERMHVRAVIDAMRRDRVRLAVTREKRDAMAIKGAANKWPRWVAVRRLNLDPGHFSQPGEGVEASAADQAKGDAHALPIP